MSHNLFCITDQFYHTASTIDFMSFKDKMIIISDMYVSQTNKYFHTVCWYCCLDFCSHSGDITVLQ